MKLANLFLITALVGVLAAIGCSEDSNGGTAGTGGSGTAGTGGSGTAGTGGAMPTACDAATCTCGQADTPCVIECSDKDCSQECDGAGVACAVKCSGGGCAQECDGGASCVLTCEGGDCTQNCEGDASYCRATCTGGNCTGSGTGGTGGSGGSGGQCTDGELCCIEVCASDADLAEPLRQVCLNEYNNCVDGGGMEAQCKVAAEETCTL